MKFERRFVNTEERFPAIKKKNIVISIIAGLFFAFVFYSFLYLSREIIRVLSITDKYDIFVLSDKEVVFYNLFFAFLSLIFAQSICLSQWFGKPRKVFEKGNIYKSAIVNDQLFLNTLFLYWFTRVATLYALFMVVTPLGGFYVFSFYPKYNYLFILFLIVLFLQTWVSIRRIYKRKALKWMLLSATTISVLAFALSRINLVDYQKINQICFEKNIEQKYNLELAEVEVEALDYFYPLRGSDIYLVRHQSDIAEFENPLIIFRGNELSFDDLEHNILLYLELVYDHPRLLRFPLYIDRSIKMSFVNRLKEIMSSVEIGTVGYAAIPKNREFDKRYYSNYSNYYSVWRLISQKAYKQASLEGFEHLSVCYVNDSLKINNITCTSKDFYLKLIQQIETNDNYLLLFSVDEEMIFDDYIFVLSEFRRAVKTLRNEYAIKYYSTEFENLDFEKDSVIRNRIPLRLIEIDGTKQK